MKTEYHAKTAEAIFSPCRKNLLRVLSGFFARSLKKLCYYVWEISVIVDLEEAEIGLINRLVVTTLSVIVTDEDHLIVRYTVLTAIEVESVIFVIGLGCHIEG